MIPPISRKKTLWKKKKKEREKPVSYFAHISFLSLLNAFKGRLINRFFHENRQTDVLSKTTPPRLLSVWNATLCWNGLTQDLRRSQNPAKHLKRWSFKMKQFKVLSNILVLFVIGRTWNRWTQLCEGRHMRNAPTPKTLVWCLSWNFFFLITM